MAKEYESEHRDLANSSHGHERHLSAQEKSKLGDIFSPGKTQAEEKLPINSQSEKDIEKLRLEVLEQRERLLKVRETDILSLREKVDSLGFQLKVGLAIVGIVGTIIAGFGIKQYSDLDELINKGLNSKMDESLGYYDQLGRALMNTNYGNCSSAIPIFKDLAEKRPDDEMIFLNAIYCFNEREEYKAGYEFISALKEKGVFPKKYESMLSFNNAGFLVFVRSLTEPSLEKEALELLKRAEQIGRLEENKDLNTPLYNLALFYISKGDTDKAAIYSNQIHEAGSSNPNWKSEIEKKWFKDFEAKQPKAQQILEQLFPADEQNPNTRSTTK